MITKKLTRALRFDQLGEILNAIDCQTIVPQIVLAQLEAADQFLMVRSGDGGQVTA